jgi:lipoate-protein ligase A
MSEWRVEHVRGTAGEIHALELPPERAIWIFEVRAPALVLGSTQRAVEIAVPGLDVVHRRSGGGAVWVDPASTIWVDVVVPRGDARWDDDVGRATHWLGDAWAAAVPGSVVHRGGLQRSALSDLVCFAGLGPGELTRGGRKVVGISQRRTRAAARFQCVAYERWDAGPLEDALGLERGSIAARGDAVGPRDVVVSAFLASV